MDILEQADTLGINPTASQFNVSSKQIRYWRRNRDHLASMVESGSANAKTMHRGPVCKLLDRYDAEMVDEFDRFRGMGRKVSNMTMCRVYRRLSKDNDTTIRSLSAMIHRWFVRHKFNLRRVTHVAQNTRWATQTVRCILLMQQHV